MLGWCMTGYHVGKELEGPGTTCPGRIWPDKTKPEIVCSCWCHDGDRE